MGFSVGEIMWAVEPDGIRPAAIVPRAQTRFKFDVDYKLRLLTTTDTLRGIEMPERKFIVHRHGGKDNNPYGLGLGSSLFWPVLFKRQGVSFWLTFLDKFGSPTPLGKYPSNATKSEKATLLNAAKSLRQESATIIPDGMALELLETGSSVCCKVSHSASLSARARSSRTSSAEAPSPLPSPPEPAAVVDTTSPSTVTTISSSM